MKEISEQEFQCEVDALFLAIEHWLEACGTDIDFESNEGLLTVVLPNKNQIVFSRQTQKKEIWVASPLGAYHFHRIAQDWQTHQGQSLLTVFCDNVLQQANMVLDLTLFKK